MIIDLRTRIWSNPDQLGPEVATRLRRRYADRWQMLDASAAAHERATAQVGASCVLGFRSAVLGATVPNELVAGHVAADPRRRIGIAGIDPLAPGAMLELDKAVNLGLAGVTVSPAAQGFHPSHSLAMRLYERCAELKLPVIVANDIPLSSTAVLEFARPLWFDEVARNVPELRLVIGEFGSHWIGETIALVGKHVNVYTDVACISSRPWELYNALLAAAGAGVMDKVLFGSGFPFGAPTQAIESLYSVNSFAQGSQLPSVQRSLIRAVVERDSLSVLGIESEVVVTASDVDAHGSALEPVHPRMASVASPDGDEADIDDDRDS